MAMHHTPETGSDRALSRVYGAFVTVWCSELEGMGLRVWKEKFSQELFIFYL